MKIPKRLKVLSQVYKVSVCPQSKMIEYSMGSCDSANLQIKIAAGQKEPLEADTFLHECLEAIKAQLGINLPHRSIVAISAALLDVIRKNKLDFRQ